MARFCPETAPQPHRPDQETCRPLMIKTETSGRRQRRCAFGLKAPFLFAICPISWYNERIEISCGKEARRRTAGRSEKAEHGKEETKINGKAKNKPPPHPPAGEGARPGLGTLFAGLLLMALAFVQGESVWRTLHDGLFGLLGCGALVLGAAVCCLAVLYTRGEDLLPHISKLALGLVLATGGVIVLTGVPVQGLSAFQIVAVCYRNGYEAVLSGGAAGCAFGRHTGGFVRSSRCGCGHGRADGLHHAVPAGSDPG